MGYIFFGFQLSCRDLNEQTFTLEGIFCEEHEVEQDSQCPHVDENAIGLSSNYFGRHILFSPALGAGPDFANRSRESEVSNLVRKPLTLFKFEQNIFRFYVSMNESVLVDVFKPFQHLRNNVQGICQRKGSAL